jgi:hypothetical protein
MASIVHWCYKGQSSQRGRGRGTSSGQPRSSTAPASAPSAPVSYDEYRDMPCFAHRDASGKCNHTNRNCKFVNDIKADQEATVALWYRFPPWRPRFGMQGTEWSSVCCQRRSCGPGEELSTARCKRNVTGTGSSTVSQRRRCCLSLMIFDPQNIVRC